MMVELWRIVSSQNIHSHFELLQALTVHARVPLKEVSWPQKQRNRLRGHNRKVFGRGEVRDSKSVPENNVCVGNILVWVGCYPFRQAFGG